jgi:CubicO group peptidase (beta-lactamase class C family)
MGCGGAPSSKLFQQTRTAYYQIRVADVLSTQSQLPPNGSDTHIKVYRKYIHV